MRTGQQKEFNLDPHHTTTQDEPTTTTKAATRNGPEILAGITPGDDPHTRWARDNIPGADRPGISATQLADLCIREIRRILKEEE